MCMVSRQGVLLEKDGRLGTSEVALKTCGEGRDVALRSIWPLLPPGAALRRAPVADEDMLVKVCGPPCRPLNERIRHRARREARKARRDAVRPTASASVSVSSSRYETWRWVSMKA
jgi:hypothetical protein